jgi:hypothetical protein
MRAQDIVIGKSYRFKEHPTYGYVKALEVLKPKQRENTKPYIIVKCEHTINKNDSFGFIRYFRPVEFIKER